jgi:hypothetical protein
MVWNPSGFHLSKFIRKDIKFNASYCVPQTRNALSVSRGVQIGRVNWKLIMDADIARPHTAKVTLDFMERNVIKRAPHPTYSPDLSPSDLYLCGHVNQLLI